MLRLKLYSCVYQNLQRITSFRAIASREFASKASIAEVQEIDFAKPHTVICSSGIIACWHPDPKFPYEHTRPIDLELLKKKENSSSVFRSQVLQEDILQKYKRGPNSCDLQEIFYTKKHQFAPRTREKKLYGVSAPIPERK